MPVADILRDTETRMKKSIESANHDFATLRTGRANPTLLDNLKADYYGQETPVSQMAVIAAPEPRTILITPWDKSTMGAIEKAILKSNLGMVPNNDGTSIRLNVPPLTEERRKDFVKQLSQKAEAGRVALRNIRRDANEQFKKDEAVTDDDAKRAEKDVQKLLDKYLIDLDKMHDAKKAELLEV